MLQISQMQSSLSKKQKFLSIKNTRGSLLLELLIVIAILAIILSVGSQAVLVSMQSGKISGERDIGIALASEGLEAVRAVTEERWHNLYNKTKGSQHYYATSTAPIGKWSLATTSVSADEQIILNGITYTRYIIIDNVNRDTSTRNIVSAGGEDDPSTQKVTVTVSWPNAEPVSFSDYFFRFKNKTCSQGSWVGAGGSGNTVQSCGATTYDTIDSTISTSTGTLKLI
ncbi:MAG: hypothetical protein WAZ40_03170 [Minisyncoccia bacterium]